MFSRVGFSKQPFFQQPVRANNCQRDVTLLAFVCHIGFVIWGKKMKPMNTYARTKAISVGAWTKLICVFLGCVGVAGQSVDALLDKLVEKGVITVKEANELREEADKDFTRAYQVKSGMPDWVTSLKINGDIRGRFEGFYGENSEFVDRNRFRYRARLGFTASLLDNFEVGLRLTSSERTDNFGGDPISGNTTLADNASKKFVFIDLAYGKWMAINSADVGLAATIGKMENPFVYSDMVFDPDYTPEGAALQLTYKPADAHTFRFNTAAFVLDELGASSRDPYLVGVQARWDAAWSGRVATTAGVGFMAVGNRESLRNDAVPNVNRGNSRTGASAAAAAPRYGFNPIVLDAAATYMLESFPYYAGPFPVKLSGEYMINPAAPRSAENYAYSVGFTFGKAGKRKTWELGYTWKWLGANAWWEEFVDSDFGAYYQNTAAPVNLLDGFVTTANPTGRGYSAGTNTRGHIVRLSYSPTDHVTLSGKVFFTELIEPAPTGSESGMTRLQVDASLRF